MSVLKIGIGLSVKGQTSSEKKLCCKAGACPFDAWDGKNSDWYTSQQFKEEGRAFCILNYAQETQIITERYSAQELNEMARNPRTAYKQEHIAIIRKTSAGYTVGFMVRNGPASHFSARTVEWPKSFEKVSAREIAKKLIKLDKKIRPD